MRTGAGGYDVAIVGASAAGRSASRAINGNQHEVGHFGERAETARNW